MVKCLVLGVVSSVFVAGGFAETAYWTNNVSSTAQWKSVGNWTDGEGQLLPGAPESGSDIHLADMPPLPDYANGRTIYPNQTINTGSITGASSRVGLDGYGINPVIGSIVGDDRHTICFPSTQGATLIPPERTFSLTDASGFRGWWCVAAPRGIFEFLDSTVATPKMNNLSAAFRPSVKVTGADQTVTLDSLYSAGALEKRGPGALKIGATSGERVVVYHTAGTLEFAGTPDAGLGAVFAKAALHLDATREDTMTKVPGDDGYVHVTAWRDANGHSSQAQDYNYYTPSPTAGKIARSNTPFLSDARSLTGLPYVDFGSKISNGIAFGPTNCLLAVSPYLTNVRAVFYAVDMDQGHLCAHPVADLNSNHFLSDVKNTLFNKNWAHPHVLYGDLTVNGIKTTYDVCPIGSYTNQYVLGVATLGSVAVGSLGCDRRIAESTGGFRLGEVLIYTNELTRAERTRITDYLMAKWQGTVAGVDADAVVVSSASAPIRVDAGRTAKVRNLVVPASGFVKTGGGVLSVEAMVPPTAPIVVQGGSVRFARGTVEEPIEPAAAPYAWFDANSAADKFDVSGDYLTAWRDVRGTHTMSATPPGKTTRTAPHLPRLVKNACGDLSAVDFGYALDGDYSGMYLPEHASGGQRLIYAGYMVVRIKDASVSGYQRSYFGSRYTDFIRGTKGYPLAINYMNADSAPQAALWTVNGRPIDPLAEQPELLQNTDFFVIGFSSEEKLRVDSLTQCQTGDDNCGNAQIGEVLLYDRKLTEEERRATEAYLMKRWLGKSIPAAEDPKPESVQFASDVDLVFDTDADMSFKAVSGGNGNIVKRGAGAVNLPTMSASSVSSLVAEEGALNLALVNPDNFLSSALFHLDASALSSFTDYEVVNGVTNLTTWADVRGNGFSASAVKDSFATVNPTLRMVEMADGVSRPVVDFGEFCGKQWEPLTGTVKNEWTGEAAGMNFSSAFSTVMDAYTVFADAHGANRAWIFGKAHYYIRSITGNGAIFNAYTSNPIPYSPGSLRDNVSIDGTAGNRYSVLSSGFHVIAVNNNANTTASIAGLACGSASGADTSSGMNDRQTVSVAGGCQIAETLAFDHVLDADKRSYLQRYLAWKWKGAEYPGALLTNVLESVSVAADATVSISLPYGGMEVLQVPEISGGGVIGAERICGVSQLGFSVRSAEDRDVLTVRGAVDFADEVSVAFDGDLRDLPAGEYPLVVADEIGEVDLSRWTIASDVSRVRKILSFYQKGSVIGLKVEPNGLLLLVR